MIELKIEKAILLGFSDGANIAMKFAVKHPEKIKALILNGGNLDTSGVKKTVQIPIEIGYKIVKHFADKSKKAKHHMELLNLIVNEPHITIEDIQKFKHQHLSLQDLTI